MNYQEIYSYPALQPLEKYRAPDKLLAAYSRVPIAEIKWLRKHLREAFPAGSKYRYRIRFQGPRYGALKISTIKRHATHCIVYIDINNHVIHQHTNPPYVVNKDLVTTRPESWKDVIITNLIVPPPETIEAYGRVYSLMPKKK